MFTLLGFLNQYRGDSATSWVFIYIELNNFKAHVFRANYIPQNVPLQVIASYPVVIPSA